MRRILPLRLERSWALEVLPASPTPAYSLPSGPKAILPPSWIEAFCSPVRIGRTEPPRRKRTMRLSLAVVRYA
jgi:hypothetical protein